MSMNRFVNDFSKKELLALSDFYHGKPFNGFVIVPTNHVHDSGFQCMKYILLDKFEIVGVVGGGSDVIRINGIGGFGKEPDYAKQLVKAHDFRIDCLHKSKCLRFFCNEYLELAFDGFVGSDFIFYVKEQKK